MRGRFLVVSGFFLLSGFSSLIYQVIWTRLLVFVFGSTTFATSTVLSVFMGGLALGSFLAGRLADRSQRPFLAYGILEGLIGVWALLAPLLFWQAIPLYKAFYPHLHTQLILFSLLRFAVAAVILLPPTACMGATLPYLARFVTQSMDTVGNRVGRLYALNTMGAVLGAIIAGFCLIPACGISCTTYFAASVNLLLAAGVVVLAGRLEIEDLSQEAQPSKASSPAKQRLPFPIVALMIAFAISGALAMVYEVTWTRSLLMVVGSTTYAFTVMLSTFLIGIFLGSWFCSRVVDKLKAPLLAFAAVEVLLCFAGFLALVLFKFLPAINLSFGSLWGTGQFSSMLARFLSAGGIMVPISLCLGATFPLAVKVCAQDLKHIGSSIGSLYAVNTCGAIVGAFAAGFIIIPVCGSEQTLALTSLANLFLGLLLLAGFGNLSSGFKAFAILGALALTFYLGIYPLHIWDISSIVYSQSDRRELLAARSSVKTVPIANQWRMGVKPLTIEGLSGVPQLLFYREGPCANVAVGATDTPAAGRITTLFTNGHADASDFSDMDNQAMLAALPLLFKPQSRDICLIGWGSGVTAGYALRFPIAQLICSEIEPAVLATSRFFHRVNFIPENDKRTVIEPSDGRNFLLASGRKFDVIISEPSNPWQAGVCNLFTREYFSICADSLNDDGVFAMWCQVSEMPTENLVQIYAALRTAFPQVIVMDSGTGDTIALACKKKGLLNFNELARGLQLPGIRDCLARFGIQGPDDIVARIRICPGGLEKAIAGSKLNTDDMNYLEYEVSRSYESRLFVDENDEWFLKNAGALWSFVDWGKISAAEKAAEMSRIARSCLNRSSRRALLWIKESMRVLPNPHALSLEAQIKIIDKDYAAAAAILERGRQMFPEDARFVGLLGVLALRQGDYLRARPLLEAAVKLASDNFSFRYFLALTYSPLDLFELDGVYSRPPSLDAQKVIELCEPASKNATFVASRPELLLLLADALRSSGNYERSKDLLNLALKRSAASFIVWRQLALTLAELHEQQQAEICLQKSRELVAAEVPALLSRARKARKQHEDVQALRLLQLVLEMSPENQSAWDFLRDYARADKRAAGVYEMMAPASGKGS